MTIVRYLCPRRQLSSSIPILVSPSRRSRPRETSSTTRLMILPTVCQPTRMSWLQALWEHWVASQATWSSKARMKSLPCRAQGTWATTTPCSRQRTRGAAASR
jgi:hypothetical protein